MVTSFFLCFSVSVHSMVVGSVVVGSVVIGGVVKGADCKMLVGGSSYFIYPASARLKPD
jgi:hypothetical protein